MSDKVRSRVEDAHEKVVGYVTFVPRKAPRFIRDARTGKIYQAELDHFCTFSHYEEIQVLTVDVEPADLPSTGSCPQCRCTNAHEEGCASA